MVKVGKLIYSVIGCRMGCSRECVIEWCNLFNDCMYQILFIPSYI